MAIHKHVRTLALALCAVILPAWAQTVPATSPQATASPTPSLTTGEVRKIDRELGKITLKHGEIKHLDMPPMTMVFVVKDKALLDKATVGAKILFMARYDNGLMTVTEIQPTQ
ncbi:MAG: copper-binding protein [Rhodoferax sp.]|nr:MAG: copper-binding protein [Rhodoferax sp.]